MTTSEIIPKIIRAAYTTFNNSDEISTIINVGKNINPKKGYFIGGVNYNKQLITVLSEMDAISIGIDINIDISLDVDMIHFLKTSNITMYVISPIFSISYDMPLKDVSVGKVESYIKAEVLLFLSKYSKQIQEIANDIQKL